MIPTLFSKRNCKAPHVNKKKKKDRSTKSANESSLASFVDDVLHVTTIN